MMEGDDAAVDGGEMRSKRKGGKEGRKGAYNIQTTTTTTAEALSSLHLVTLGHSSIIKKGFSALKRTVKK